MHPQAQQVELGHPRVLQVVLVVLDAEQPLCARRLDRHEFGETAMLVAEDEAPEVGAHLEEPAGEPSRDLEEELVPVGGLEGVAAHGGLRESFLPALQRVVDPVAVPESRRHVTGELVDFAGGVPKGPRAYPHGPA
jgi:hypothetical protein